MSPGVPRLLHPVRQHGEVLVPLDGPRRSGRVQRRTGSPPPRLPVQVLSRIFSPAPAIEGHQVPALGCCPSDTQPVNAVRVNRAKSPTRRRAVRQTQGVTSGVAFVMACLPTTVRDAGCGTGRVAIDCDHRRRPRAHRAVPELVERAVGSGLRLCGVGPPQGQVNRSRHHWIMMSAASRR